MIKGAHHSLETKQKIAIKATGRIGWNKGQRFLHAGSFKKGRIVPIEIRQKIAKSNTGKQHTEEHKRKIREAQKGNKNGNWKGGITPENRRIRQSLEYKLWRKSVFERDNYTCIWCGNNESGNLNADHIKPFAQYPELRFAIDNGRTLCIPCHKTTESYMRPLPK